MEEEPAQPSTHLTPDPSEAARGARARRAAKALALDLTPLRESREFRLLFVGQAVSFFGSMMTFVALPWQTYKLTFLALAGAADMVSGLFRMTVWNQTIPDHLRGRLAGIEMISYTTGPMLGNAEAGAVARLFGVRASVVSGGVLCVAGTALLALPLPQLIRYDARAGLARKLAEEEARAPATVETG